MDSLSNHRLINIRSIKPQKLTRGKNRTDIRSSIQILSSLFQTNKQKNTMKTVLSPVKFTHFKTLSLLSVLTRMLPYV